MVKNHAACAPRIVVKRGIVRYRSKSLVHQKAEQFAHMLAHNPRFSDVEVVRAGRDRFYVSFAPANPVRQHALRERAQQEQTQRGREQRDDFVVVSTKSYCDELHGDDLREATVRNRATGREYTVSPYGECSCAHFQFRLATARIFESDIACKHIEFVRSWSDEAIVP